MILLKNLILFNKKKPVDVFIEGKKIKKIEKSGAIKIEKICDFVYDGDRKIVFPGLIDGHTHFLGASGESGPESRAPEIYADDYLKYGITTVVGLLGFDSLTRNVNSLVAKTRMLRKSGLNAYCLTGSYFLPPITVTGDIKKDIYFIDEIIGVGEVAIADYRSSSPTKTELDKLLKNVQMASMAKGIKPLIIFHLGDDIQGLKDLISVVEKNKINPQSVVVTHINRTRKLLDFVLKLKINFWFDLTAIYFKNKPKNFYHIEEALIYINKNNPKFFDRLTITSDSGCYIEKNNLVKPAWLFQSFVNVLKDNLLKINVLEKIYFHNPSLSLGLKNKGKIEEGYDADLIILNRKLEIDLVINQGKIVYKKGEKLLKHYPTNYED